MTRVSRRRLSPRTKPLLAAALMSAVAVGMVGCKSRNGGNASVRNNAWLDATHMQAGGQTSLQAAEASGDDVNARDKFGRTPLHYAVYYRNNEATMSLIAHHAEIDPVDKDGKTPLNMAADERNAQAATMLLDAGANPNLVDRRGRTPLWLAAYRGQTAIVQAMLAKGADSTVTDPKGRTPADVAADQGFPALADTLRAASPRPATSLPATRP